MDKALKKGKYEGKLMGKLYFYIQILFWKIRHDFLSLYALNSAYKYTWRMVVVKGNFY